MAITMYGAEGCGDCRRSRAFLRMHEVDFEYVDLESNPDAIQEVITRNEGRRIIPTIVFDDGSHLSEPSDRELAEYLGLPT